MADEPKPDQATDNPVRPEWLPEKFKDGAALVESYSQLESKLGELSERAKQADALEENYNELAARLEQVETQRPQQSNDPADAYVNAYTQAMEMGDYRTAIGIHAQISQMAAQNAITESRKEVDQRYQTLEDSQANEIGVYAARTLEQKYGDQFEQARGSMQEILKANPFLIPDSAKYDPQAAVVALDNVYKIATYGAAPATPDASVAEQAKQAAQTATGAGTRVLTPDEQKQEWDAIRAAAQRSYWEPQ